MTFKECLIKTRKLINYYSIAGNIVADSDKTQKDYTARAAGAIDMAQKEIAGVCPLVKHMFYMQYALRPLALKRERFAPGGSFELNAKGASAFSFTADGNVSAELLMYDDGEWEQLLEISKTSDGEEIVVYAEADIVPDEDVPVKLIITGTFVNIACLAMFRSFPRREDIPVYGRDRRHELPEGFYRAAMVSAQPFQGKVRKRPFYTVDEETISFPWEFAGKVDMAYEVYPRTVTESTADNFKLDLPDNAAEVIPYFAASMLLTDEDPKMSQFFLKMYNERLESLIRPEAQCVVNTLWN